MTQTAVESLEVARRHLSRVQASWEDPTDWDDLSLHGFYCLEACVVAAALHLGRQRPSNHRAKVEEARHLATSEGLADVGDLLVDLNTQRKHMGYGDTAPLDDELDPETVATEIEHYFKAVESLLAP